MIDTKNYRTNSNNFIFKANKWSYGNCIFTCTAIHGILLLPMVIVLSLEFFPLTHKNREKYVCPILSKANNKHLTRNQQQQ